MWGGEGSEGSAVRPLSDKRDVVAWHEEEREAGRKAASCSAVLCSFPPAAVLSDPYFSFSLFFHPTFISFFALGLVAL